METECPRGHFVPVHMYQRQNLPGFRVDARWCTAASCFRKFIPFRRIFGRNLVGKMFYHSQEK